MSHSLEEALYRDPSAETWAVYADWLQSQGDPRGELVAAALAGRDIEALLEANEEAFWGPFVPGRAWGKHAEIVWGYGFWREARIGVPWGDWDAGDLSDAVAALLRHDSARFLSALTLGLVCDLSDGDYSWSDAIAEVVAAGPRPSLRSLFIGDFHRNEPDISSTEMGDLSSLWPQLPALERLRLHAGQFDLGPLDTPRLVDLRLQTGSLSRQSLDRVIEAPLPEIEHLELWFGRPRYGGDCAASDVVRLLSRTDLPKLRSLGLMNAEFADEIPALLLRSPLLPRLARIDLSMGTLTEAGAQVLLDGASALAHLEEIDLSDNAVFEETSAQLARALPHTRIVADEPKLGWLYASVGE